MTATRTIIGTVISSIERTTGITATLTAIGLSDKGTSDSMNITFVLSPHEDKNKNSQSTCIWPTDGWYDDPKLHGDEAFNKRNENWNRSGYEELTQNCDKVVSETIKAFKDDLDGIQTKANNKTNVSGKTDKHKTSIPFQKSMTDVWLLTQRKGEKSAVLGGKAMPRHPWVSFQISTDKAMGQPYYWDANRYVRQEEPKTFDGGETSATSGRGN